MPRSYKATVKRVRFDSTEHGSANPKSNFERDWFINMYVPRRTSNLRHTTKAKGKRTVPLDHPYFVLSAKRGVRVQPWVDANGVEVTVGAREVVLTRNFRRYEIICNYFGWYALRNSEAHEASNMAVEVKLTWQFGDCRTPLVLIGDERCPGVYVNNCAYGEYKKLGLPPNCELWERDTTTGSAFGVRVVPGKFDGVNMCNLVIRAVRPIYASLEYPVRALLDYGSDFNKKQKEKRDAATEQQSNRATERRL